MSSITIRYARVVYFSMVTNPAGRKVSLRQIPNMRVINAKFLVWIAIRSWIRIIMTMNNVSTRHELSEYSTFTLRVEHSIGIQRLLKHTLPTGAATTDTDTFMIRVSTPITGNSCWCSLDQTVLNYVQYEHKN